MILDRLAKPTEVIRPGMQVSSFFERCIRYNVSGLPYVNEQGILCGRLSMRHLFRETCIPPYLLRTAHFLGDDIDAVNIPHQQAFDLLARSVDSFVLKQYAFASPNSPIIKGLAMMEQFGTNYIFIVDGSDYHGIVTRQDIARRMIEATKDFIL